MLWTFTGEPRDAAYAALLAYATGCCRSALLVVRDGLGLSAAGAALLDGLPGVTSRRGAEWPGTRLLGHEATLYEAPLTRATATVLREAARGLYEWRQPALPEDLCLLRADGATWLGSTAHERDAFLDAEPAEVDALRSAAPEVAALLRPDA